MYTCQVTARSAWDAVVLSQLCDWNKGVIERQPEQVYTYKGVEKTLDDPNGDFPWEAVVFDDQGQQVPYEQPENEKIQATKELKKIDAALDVLNTLTKAIPSNDIPVVVLPAIEQIEALKRWLESCQLDAQAREEAAEKWLTELRAFKFIRLKDIMEETRPQWLAEVRKQMEAANYA
jgi:hypothetical protein